MTLFGFGWRVRFALAFVAAALAMRDDPARADDKPKGVAPTWEDPAGFERVPLPGLATPPANGGWYVGENDAACEGAASVGSTNIGQTFIPRTDRIWRMHFTANSAYNGNIDPRPGIVRIYKWQAGGYRATVAERPLFVQHFDLSTDVNTGITLYPDLRFSAQQQDETYFVEFSIPGKERKPPQPTRTTYGLDTVKATTDPYPDGALYAQCALQQAPRPEGPPGRQTAYWWDLAFEFHGAAARRAAARPLHPSDPAARWLKPLAPLADDPRDEYWRRVNEFAQFVRTAALSPFNKGGDVHLLNETFLYFACKNDGKCPLWLEPEDLLDNVQALFARAVAERAECRDPKFPDCYIQFYPLLSPGLAALLLREAGELDRFPRKLQDGIRDLIFKRALEGSFFAVETGTHAAVLNSMAAYFIFHVLYPAQTPQAWIDYYQKIWRSWWDVRETETDSEGYQQLGLYYILVVASWAKDAPDASKWYSDIWADPHFRKLVDRYQQMVTPIGTFPNYGDGSGVSLMVPALIWLFEEAAVHFDDPSYRETARRLIDYNSRHVPMRARSASGYWEPLEVGPPFHGLSLAYLAAGNARVPDLPSNLGSLYTLRRKAGRLGGPPPPAPGYTFSRSASPTSDIPAALFATVPGVQTEHYVPDKLILRSGGGRDGLSFVFDLLNGYQHGHPELGALSSYTDDGSILMMDGPFPYHLYRHHAEDESAPVMRHYRGGIIDFSKRGTHVSIARFAEADAATVAWISFGDVQGWQVRQQRHFLFAKDRFLLVRDGFEAGPTQPGGIEVAVGPVWHAADVHPAHDTQPDASDWYDVYDRQPVGNTTRFRNPERYSLVYFVGRSGYSTAAYKEGAYLTLADSSRSPDSVELNPACKEPGDPLRPVQSGRVECRNTPAFVLYQKWTGTLQTGESRWFDTLLLPHAREAPEAVAARVRELAVGDDYTALQVEVEDETWIVVDNPRRQNVSAERLTGALATSQPYLTNAEYLMLRFKPGSPAYVVVSQADFIHTGAYTGEFSPASTGAFHAEPDSRTPRGRN